MPKHDISTIKQRVQARLRDLDMTPAEAARRGKLPKDFIYDLLNDRKKTIRSDNIFKLSLALDCDWTYLDGSQQEVSIVDNIVDFDRPPVYLIGDVSPNVFMRREDTKDRWRQAPDMPTLPPDTRFEPAGQVDLYIKGNSINRFAPSGYILRCVLLDFWPEYIRDGDLVVVERYQGELFERAAWRVRPTAKYIEFSTDTDEKAGQITWRAPVLPEGVIAEDHKPYAMAIYAYAMPRIRRMF